MKAVTYTEYGTPDVLQFSEVDKPVPEDDEVLVRVHAVSVNDWDWGLLRGKPFVNRIMHGLRKPNLQILGSDIAGVVEVVGENVTRLQPGDAVFGDLCECGWGGFAEWVCAKEDALTLKPAGMSFEQAAAIPQAGLLALQGLGDENDIPPGTQVLINGAGGGAGTIAIQIAKTRGAEVTGVDRTNKLELMRSLGADHVIDFTRKDFTKTGEQYDLILDVTARRSVFTYQRVLRPGGRYAAVGGDTAVLFHIALLGRIFSLAKDKKMALVIYEPNQGLDRMIELFESGKAVPVIDRVYPLDETAEAFRYFGSGKHKGKIVISVAN
ncbi:MAG: NAD(P)-dependent alcohol dehydrogenase [Candidatus Marinimicrobia bacterium]|nr:NAD(P)-dependent alcohol dehydrogenase [Candidatus Neomarinimicrobiota bacterium]MCF7827890.1 NAD(P)-dependent alcohol dehydrogenase [Candidatus Neomarinimicrobiota bacterium]MCF7879355.1 NAD(P)-dependent alcohol dehydrogenase [Candidatus Neomarinimicrobiota bacterium]